ncbi:Endoribonuclease Dicer 1 [Tetrabaena socialis]|uniref:Endoribonuclease Dicer 1 n=1 Tax=Tetrabaena socialis TaxID=47790 RepID=A0A2J8AHK6_9CHLO|nr:Endoribonuclease Dicer 1 [Tetrabaena socialis]|eukprot:PNH11987.1 Endoribonuclease Dicer 1 [Tetrabaena socialis]
MSSTQLGERVLPGAAPGTGPDAAAAALLLVLSEPGSSQLTVTPLPLPATNASSAGLQGPPAGQAQRRPPSQLRERGGGAGGGGGDSSEEEEEEDGAEDDMSLIAADGSRLPDFQLGALMESGSLAAGGELSGSVWVGAEGVGRGPHGVAVASARALSCTRAAGRAVGGLARLRLSAMRFALQAAVDDAASMLPLGLREALALPPLAGGAAEGGSIRADGSAGLALEAQVVVTALAAAAAALTEVMAAAVGCGGGEAVLKELAGQLYACRRLPLEARDAGRLLPWAERLMRLAPPEELQRQVLELPPGVGPAMRAPAPGAAPAGLRLVTAPVQWLIATLQDHHKPRGSAAVGAAMVFCQRKITCLALQRLLQELPCVRGVLRSSIFMGNSTTEISALSLAMSPKKQERVRQDFSSGRLNLLLCTDVGAEGLDFRQAQLVIMYDPPKHVTPFVQSRGRARAAGGRFLLLARSGAEVNLIAKHARSEAAMVEEALKRSEAARQGNGEEGAPGRRWSEAQAAGVGDEMYTVPETADFVP